MQPHPVRVKFLGVYEYGIMSLLGRRALLSDVLSQPRFARETVRFLQKYYYLFEGNLAVKKGLLLNLNSQ